MAFSEDESDEEKKQSMFVRKKEFLQFLSRSKMILFQFDHRRKNSMKKVIDRSNQWIVETERKVIYFFLLFIVINLTKIRMID